MILSEALGEIKTIFLDTAPTLCANESETPHP
jgi:hypothetical protein